jgi:hypothetical protein
VWNQWRKEHPALQPDLSFADLHEYPLAGINFSYVYLHGAHLIRIDLDNSKLEGAYLHDSDLFHASLINANLAKVGFSRTNLNKARMIRANLSGAHIHDVNFVGADLREANMTGAFLSQSVFDGVDLRQVKGLDTVRHLSPSAISLRTIILSGGKIPEVFLRGVGIPEAIIEQIPALIGSLNPIDYYSCFISYSSKDQDFADRLYADLQSKGVRCWFAPHDMRIGDRIRPRIDESIRLYDKLLLILSYNSVASHWVEHELETALGKELEGKPNVLFPIRLDEMVMQSRTGWASHIRLTRHIGDFTNWKNHDDYQQAFNRLLRDLKAEAETIEG